MRKCYKENKRTGGWVVMWVEKDCLQHCTQFYSLEVQGRNVFSNPPSPPLLPILLLNIWKDPWLSASPFHSPQKWWWAGGTWKETSWNCLIDILVGAGHQLPVLTSRGQIAAGWYRASCGGRSLSEPTSQKPDKWEMEKKEKVHFSRIVLLASIAMQGSAPLKAMHVATEVTIYQRLKINHSPWQKRKGRKWPWDIWAVGGLPALKLKQGSSESGSFASQSPTQTNSCIANIAMCPTTNLVLQQLD